MDEFVNRASEFIDQVEKFSKSKLKRKAELLRIYEEVLKNKTENAFDDLIFTAKYVNGLLRIVQKESTNAEISNLNEIKKDFSDNVNKIVQQIKTIISNADEQLKLHFEEVYFELSQQSFLNLSELLSDLEWTKMYSNEIKRKHN